MAVLAEDTSLEAERFLVRRWQIASPGQVRQTLCHAWNFAARLQGKEGEPMDPHQVTQRVLDVLADLQVDYLVGGSVASSLYGEPRFTNDTDVLAWLQRAHVEELVSRLGEEFYVSLAAALDAVARRSSFNLIHTSNYKVDLFVAGSRPFDRSRLARRVHHPDFGQNWWFSSVEDMVLAKLEWYRMGGDISDRQWRDILAMLAVRRTSLDQAYLSHWAIELGVDHLLEKAEKAVLPLTEG